MENKLTIEHLAPYLSYKVKVLTNSVIRELVAENIEINYDYKKTSITNVINGIGHRLILRPLSDLTKEIEVNGVKFVPKDELDRVWTTWSYGNIKNLTPEKLRDAPYWFMEQLFRWNFDTLGLIEKNLAININTLK